MLTAMPLSFFAKSTDSNFVAVFGAISAVVKSAFFISLLKRP